MCTSTTSHTLPVCTDAIKVCAAFLSMFVTRVYIILDLFFWNISTCVAYDPTTQLRPALLALFWRYCALIFNPWLGWKLEFLGGARSFTTETVTSSFSPPFSLPSLSTSFPFHPFRTVSCHGAEESPLLEFINSPSGDNDPLCVRLLLWSRVSSALEGDLLPSFRRPVPLSNQCRHRETLFISGWREVQELDSCHECPQLKSKDWQELNTIANGNQGAKCLIIDSSCNLLCATTFFPRIFLPFCTLFLTLDGSWVAQNSMLRVPLLLSSHQLPKFIYRIVFSIDFGATLPPLSLLTLTIHHRASVAASVQ